MMAVDRQRHRTWNDADDAGTSTPAGAIFDTLAAKNAQSHHRAGEGHPKARFMVSENFGCLNSRRNVRTLW